MKAALLRKAEAGESGATLSRTLAEGDGWRVLDIVCTSGPGDRPFEEKFNSYSLSLVLSGNFLFRNDLGTSLMSAGAILLGNADGNYECSHQHGEGDRCLSFQFDAELFELLARDAGARGSGFDRLRLPPLRELAPQTARASAALSRDDSFEEIALELAGAAIQAANGRRIDDGFGGGRNRARIADVLRHLESTLDSPHTLAELAEIAGLSRYHFIREFRAVTGVTPHQWLLRARFRDAAERLVARRDSVTDIALDVGFDDLSNFIRSFRAEFGVSPSRYRALT